VSEIAKALLMEVLNPMFAAFAKEMENHVLDAQVSMLEIANLILIPEETRCEIM
jgi:hypothetical protein